MEEKVFIKVVKNGPYEVFGRPKTELEEFTEDEEGVSWDYKTLRSFTIDQNPTALCRCGHSKNPPYCDGSHQHVEWDAEEAGDFEPIMDSAEAFEGPNLTLFDNEKYCAFARFCDAKGRVWNLVEAGTEESDELAKRETFNCPAGRLMIYDNKTGKNLEPPLEQKIGVIEDRQMQCSGPLRVNGSIPVESADGRFYEVRNRQTLCRCGKSQHKPFCDGSHAGGIKYRDGL